MGRTAIETTDRYRWAPGACVLAMTCSLLACVSAPFEHEGTQGQAGPHEHLLPAPDLLPERDAGDSSEYESANLPLRHAPPGAAMGHRYRCAVYESATTRRRPVGLWV